MGFTINHDRVPKVYYESDWESTREELIRPFTVGIYCDSCGGSIDYHSAMPPVVGWFLSNEQIKQLYDDDPCAKGCSKIYFLHARCAWNKKVKINRIFPLEKFLSGSVVDAEAVEI